MKEFKQVRENLIDMLEDLDEKLDIHSDKVDHPEESLEKNFDAPPVLTKNAPPEPLTETQDNKFEKIKTALSFLDKQTFVVCSICGEEMQKGFINGTFFSKICAKCAKNKDQK